MLQPQRPPRLGDLATRSPQHVRIHARQQSQKTVAASIQRLRLSKKGSVAVYNDENCPTGRLQGRLAHECSRKACTLLYRRYQSCPRQVLAVHRSKRSVNPVFVPGSAVSLQVLCLRLFLPYPCMTTLTKYYLQNVSTHKNDARTSRPD